MTIATRVFLIAMAFGFAAALAYWSVTHEAVGTLLLGIFGGGLAWDSGYLLVTRGRTSVDGDSSLAPAQLAGERIGVFSVESPWPILLALASAGTLVGAVLHSILGACSFLAMLWLIWRMVLESV